MTYIHKERLKRMDKRLLAILHCPVTHKGLASAKPAILNSVNAAIAAGELSNRDGHTLIDAERLGLPNR